MLSIFLILVIAYVVAAILGLAIHGLIWLFWIAVALFVITVIASLFSPNDRTNGTTTTTREDK